MISICYAKKVHGKSQAPKKELGRETHGSLDARRILKVDPQTGETVAIFASSREAGRAAYCSYQTILDACNRKNKKQPGIAPDGFRYSWEAEEKEA